ncbi:MAG: flagellar filament capping protein FliD [Acidobacteriaceae bacterium]|jgi:flagellar hook-associated protein 2
MGAVGINFGSATSGDGFNVTTTVASIVANLQQVEDPWNTQLTSLKSDDTTLTSIGTDLASLSTSLQALTNFDGVLAEKDGSSSNPDVIALTSAGPTATAGSHAITVSQLAQTSSEYSDPIAATDTISGGLTIQVGPSGTPQTIPVVSGSSDTLATYAAAINSAGIGVSASVISDTTGSRLSLVSDTSGADGQLAITGSLADVTTPASTLHINTGLTGQDALLNVDGVAIDSGSNTVSSAIPGVTFQILAKTTTPVIAEVTNDNTDVETAFQTFVTAYNTVLTDLNTQEGNTSTGTPEPLYGNPIVAQLQSALSSALTTGSASGSISSLDQLGITVDSTGQLSLNTSTLDSALNSNYSDVVGFLQNSGSFGQTLSTSLDNLGSSDPTGAITLALASDSTQETALNDNITKQNALIATDSASLTTQLNTANQVLQSIPQQLDEINELYSALTGYNTSSSS